MKLRLSRELPIYNKSLKQTPADGVRTKPKRWQNGYAILQG